MSHNDTVTTKKNSALITPRENTRNICDFIMQITISYNYEWQVFYAEGVRMSSELLLSWPCPRFLSWMSTPSSSWPNAQRWVGVYFYTYNMALLCKTLVKEQDLRACLLWGCIKQWFCKNVFLKASIKKRTKWISAWIFWIIIRVNMNKAG